MRCFYLDATDKCRRSLRRYYSSSKTPLPCPTSEYAYHNAETPIEDGYAFKVIHSDGRLVWDLGPNDKPPKDDPRWPSQCACGYAFTDDDGWQLSTKVIYRRSDTGAEMLLPHAEPGAMWDAWWLAGMYAPTDDGRVLMVKCPGGYDWNIDGRASNCTMRDDDIHHCWVRHGQPPEITVDKNGLTCAAGGGSIIAGNYHGFLQNGEFTPPL